METAPIAPDVRDAALDIVARTLKGEPQLSTRLADLGGLDVVNVLLALEQAFQIPLDVDEVLPDLTISGLLILVQRRAMMRPVGLGAPGGCQLYDIRAFRPEVTPAAPAGGPLDLAALPSLRDAAPGMIFDSPPCPPPPERRWAAVPDAQRARHARNPLGPLLMLAATAFAAGVLAAGCFFFVEHLRQPAPTPPASPAYGPWSYLS